MVFILLLIVCVVAITVFIATCTTSREPGDWSCPHGYDDFGCQPECPLYEHCWGKREE